MKKGPESWRIFFVLAVSAVILAIPLSSHPGSNVISRVASIFQIVDAGVLHIDPWSTKTNDVSEYDGHYYNDKAPGTTLVGIPSYAIYKWICKYTGRSVNYDLARHLLRITTLLPLCLLAAWLATKYIRRAGYNSLWFAPAWLFGTVAFPFSVLFFGHQFAATFIFISFYLLYTLKTIPNRKDSYAIPIFAGLFAGLSIFTEYPLAALALPLGLYMLTFERRISRIALFGSFGAVLPAAGLALYNWASFGNPLSFGYRLLRYGQYQDGMGSGIMGVGIPKFEHLWEVTFSTASGLFFTSPWLLFAPLGIIVLILKKEHRAEGVLFGVMGAAYLAFNAGYFEPGGAASFGPRHLVPVIPFLAIAAYIGGQGLGEKVKAAFYAMVVFSIILTAFGTFADPTMPDRLKNPLFEFALPLLSHGYGLESPLGLNGVKLFALFLGLLLILWILVRNRQQSIFAQAGQRNTYFATATVLLLFYLFIAPYASHTESGIKHQIFGNYYSLRENWSSAEKEYYKATRTRVDPFLHYYRGRALAKLGRFSEMKYEFQKTLELAPDFPHKEMLERILKQVDND